MGFPREVSRISTGFSRCAISTAVYLPTATNFLSRILLFHLYVVLRDILSHFSWFRDVTLSAIQCFVAIFQCAFTGESLRVWPAAPARNRSSIKQPPAKFIIVWVPKSGSQPTPHLHKLHQVVKIIVFSKISTKLQHDGKKITNVRVGLFREFPRN